MGPRTVVLVAKFWRVRREGRMDYSRWTCGTDAHFDKVARSAMTEAQRTRKG